MHIHELQKQVTAWSRRNAPEATTDTCMQHIEEELGELRAELRGHPMGPNGEMMCNTHKIAEEAADIVILLSHLVSLPGGDLDYAVRNKWERVKQRVYTQHSDGVYRHVPEIEALKSPSGRPAKERSLADRLNAVVVHIEEGLYLAVREGKTMRADYQHFGHAVCWADFVRVDDAQVFCGIYLKWSPGDTIFSAHTKYIKPFKSHYSTFKGWIIALRRRLPGMGTEQWREVSKDER